MVGCGGPSSTPGCDVQPTRGFVLWAGSLCGRRIGRDQPSHEERPIQNWREQGGSDCLIKTKHRDAPSGLLRDVISAQCSFS